jgi:hypothetical protein
VENITSVDAPFDEESHLLERKSWLKLLSIDVNLAVKPILIGLVVIVVTIDGGNGVVVVFDVAEDV